MTVFITYTGYTYTTNTAFYVALADVRLIACMVKYGR